MKKIYIIVTVLILSMSGCASKKKITNRENHQEEKKEVVIVSEVVSKEVVIDSSFQSKTETFTTKKNESIDVVSASDSIPVTVSKETEGNVTTWNVKGAESFKISQEESNEVSKDTTSGNVNKLITESNETNTESETEESSSGSSRSSDVDISRPSTWIFVIAGFGLILLLIFFLIRRKRRNPLI